jgi:hypothetical protein
MRTRKTRGEWTAIIRAYQRSGESPEAFCAGRGLNVATFRWWLCTLRRSTGSAVAMLAVDVVAPTTPAKVVEEGADAAGMTIVIAVSDVEVRVPVGADARYVAGLVAELRRC